MAAVDPIHGQPSNVLGKFKLIAELGRGGMSEVYLAVIAGPAGFNKLVVIKLIKGDLAEDPDFINMFLEEARLSARLSHPNIVQTNEVGEVGGRYYIAMEYLEGQPYSRILHRLGRDRGLPLGMSLRILSDVLGGLQYAHDLADFDGSPLSVVHRDVTPHNVFVTYDGQVKVVDFGIAKAMNSSHETRTGMLKGKVGYMAPEQAKGERVDRRADIFSVGVMLWEAAVGRRLWKGLNEVQILHQLLSGEIPSPRSMRPDISLPLESLIMKALSPDREKRHGSATELQAALEDLMDSGSERSTLREVGRLLSSTFDEERKKLKGIIEQQVARTAMLPTGAYQHMSLPQVDHPSAFTGELQRASFAPNAVPQFGQPNGYLSSSGQFPAHAGSSSGPQSQSGMSHHGVPSVAGPQGQLSQSSPSHSNPGLSHPGLSHPGVAHPGLSHPGVAHPGLAHPGHQSHPGHSHPGHHPDHSRPSHPHSSHSYPGNAYSHPGNPYASPGHVAAVGGLPRVGPGVSGSDDHSSQPSVSSSLAHASVSHPYSTQPKQSSDNTGRKLTMVALGIAAAAGGLAALLYVGLGKPTNPTEATSTPASTAVAAPTEEPSSTTSTAEATAPATDPTADPGATEAKLEIKVKPSDAEISLDGAKIGSGVLKTTIPRDGKEHELTVDAPGYASKSRKIKPEETFIFWEPELSPQRGGGPIPRATNTATSEPTSTVRRDRNGKIIRDIERDYPGGG